MAYQEPEAKIFACSQSVYLAEKIAKSYGAELGKVTFSTYSDGEFQPSFEESIRGLRVFLVCSTFPSSDNLMELLLMIDAAKRASARHITASSTASIAGSPESRIAIRVASARSWRGHCASWRYSC